MNRPLSRLVTSLLLVLAAACYGPTDLEPSESCYGDGDARPTFGDPALEASVWEALGVAAGTQLTCAQVAYVTDLDASDAGVTSLVGIQNLVNLRYLDVTGSSLDDLSPLSGLPILQSLFASSSGIVSLNGLGNLPRLEFLDLSLNSISDIGPLAGLPSLLYLDLGGNQISDLGPLGGLTGVQFLYLGDNAVSDIGPLAGLSTLRTLYLDANQVTDLTALAGLPTLRVVDLTDNVALSDIQPLLDNGDLGSGDSVGLRGTAVDCPSVSALRAKGVTVDHGCQ